MDQRVEQRSSLAFSWSNLLEGQDRTGTGRRHPLERKLVPDVLTTGRVPSVGRSLMLTSFALCSSGIVKAKSLQFDAFL